MPDNNKISDLSSAQHPQSKLAHQQTWAQLTAEYLNDLPRQLDQIRTMLKQKDYTAIKKHAHRIKGTSATYRLDDVSESAAQLQCVADTQNPDAIAAVINKLIRLVQLHTDKLNSLTVPSIDNSKGSKMADLVPVILTVDDDPHLLNIIKHHVLKWGYTHCSATGSAEMWNQLERIIPSIILLDVQLSDGDGTALVPGLKDRFPSVPIIMITANATIEIAVKSLKSGAYDFICKPLDFERLHIEIDKAIKHNRLSLQVKAFQHAARRTDFHGMIGRSEPMRKAYRLIETVAPTDASVLLLGQTGTGKELAARAIHECSKRCNRRFVAVNAPAIPRELIESALFGHEKGAFTGAHQQHIGFCEQADSGTLFLDEICEMDYDVQAKLLRFLQDHEVQRVGAKSARTVNVRVIAATNRNPKLQIQNNKLREDFYYRLSVVSIDLVPLKQRPGDTALLTRYFLDLAAAKYGKNMSSVCPEAAKLLEAYGWPGNVRQLEHLIDQIVITNNSTELTAEMLPAEVTEKISHGAPSISAKTEEKPEKIIPSIQEMERRLILQTLELTSDSIPEAARHLGLSEATLYRKIKKFGISRTFAK